MFVAFLLSIDFDHWLVGKPYYFDWYLQGCDLNGHVELLQSY